MSELFVEYQGRYQHEYTADELREKLEAAIGKTLGEVDVAHVFDIAKSKPKVTGIAGDVIEQSVIGYPANPSQTPDLIIDGQEVELKTTGLRKSKHDKGYEAKEPMSITAVSLDTISDEDFEHSNFWHKVAHMLLVYYLYDSSTTVPAAEYANFPILGYQLHEFTPEERDTLRNDWQLVHDFVKRIQDQNPDEETRKRLYPKLSSALRSQLMLIDTAPKYPNPPRFRLKRSTVTAIARKRFGNELVQLPKRYTSYAAVDAALHDVAARFRGQTLGDMATMLGLKTRGSKNLAERIVIRMFGSDASQMSQIELFAKAGIKAKTIVLTKNGHKTEDMKLLPIDFSEFANPDAKFEDSPLREYFAEGSFICIVLQEPKPKASLTSNVFLGFKRISFDDDFIDGEARRTWEEIHYLIQSHTLRDVVSVGADGRPIRNPSGTIRSAPNFPKSHDHIVFVRGSGSDSKHKTECVNGIRMYRQQIWIRGSYMSKCLQSLPWI